ncbi:MAG TPA: ABC transporter ATP-binding protein [Herpetosiphonaceae bacterium]
MIVPGNVLVADGLSFRYGQAEQLAIHDLSFHADRGEIVLVAGSSGCGKSTLLRCINGLIPRSYKGELQGSLRIEGQDPGRLSLAQIAQIVGTVLQNPEKQIVGAYVKNEVAFGPENLGWPRDRIVRVVEEVLHRLGIAHLLERETFKLSGGEKQKVALAGVLAMQSRLLLLDEPLASLDPLSATETLRLLRALADDGHTLALVEHRIEDVLALRPERVLFMRDGRQVYWGGLAQFEAVADPREVKLPAPLVVDWARRNAQAIDLPPPPPSARPDAEPLIEFEHVDFFYDPDVPVLHEVSLTIRKGDVVAILGPNGAGKSTLVKQMIGLLKPRAGRVRVLGAPTVELTTAQIAHSVGYVFQHPGHMLFAPTVREELAFGPRNLGFDQARIDANVARAIEMVGLTGLDDRPPLALSYGQQKRVGIAAVAAMESRVLVMDEPTAGQDYRSYTAFMDAIARLQSFDALVFITHDLDLALSYANRIVLVAEGRIAADGPPERVLADEPLLRRCRVEPTSLLRLNLTLLPHTGRFLRAEGLARYLKEDHAATNEGTSNVGIGPDQQ